MWISKHLRLSRAQSELDSSAHTIRYEKGDLGAGSSRRNERINPSGVLLSNSPFVSQKACKVCDSKGSAEARKIRSRKRSMVSASFLACVCDE
jgi:hypothetical protein